VVVRSRDLSPAERESVRDAVVSELGARGAVASRPPSPSPDPGAALAADLEAGAAAYANLHPDDALARIDALLSAWESASGLGLDRAQVVRALAIGAMSALALASPARADTYLDRAILMDPAIDLPPAQYPPAIRERLASRRAAVATAARGAIEIALQPPGATLSIDGAPLDGTSRRVEVASGLHVVGARAPAHRSSGARVSVEPGATATIAITLEVDLGGALAEAERSAPESAIPADAVRAASSEGARLVVVDVARDASGLVADVRDVRDVATTARRRSLRARGAGAVALARAIALELAPPEHAALLAPARPREAAAAPAWPWIVAGGAGIAAAVVVIIAIAASAGGTEGWNVDATRLP